MNDERETVEVLREHLRNLDREFREFKVLMVDRIDKFNEKIGFILIVIVVLSFFAGMNSMINLIKFLTKAG